MKIRLIVALGLLALVPAVAMSLPIVAMPSDTTGGSPNPLRHNLFHDASVGSVNGNVLAWFDLNTAMSSTWDPTTGMLNLHVNIFSDSALSNPIGSGTATSTNFFGSGFVPFNDLSLGSISWAFSGAGAIAALGNGLTMDFINHSYSSDTAGNLANTYVGNTVTLWGADGSHNGNGTFSGATLGVDMVIVVPEPGVILLMAMGLLGIGVTVRRR